MVLDRSTGQLNGSVLEVYEVYEVYKVSGKFRLGHTTVLSQRKF